MISRPFEEPDQRRRKAVPAPPDRAELHNAALAYLARYSVSEAGLVRVLEKRIDRWARAMADALDRDAVAAAIEGAKATARTVVASLASAAVVDDATFAESRARSLRRSGRSRLAVAAVLAAKGVDAETARAALPEDEDAELAAAVARARRRRIGPFRAGPAPDGPGLLRELAVLARAGFSQDLARTVLAMDPETAELVLNRLRQS